MVIGDIDAIDKKGNESDNAMVIGDIYGIGGKRKSIRNLTQQKRKTKRRINKRKRTLLTKRTKNPHKTYRSY